MEDNHSILELNLYMCLDEYKPAKLSIHTFQDYYSMCFMYFLTYMYYCSNLPISRIKLVGGIDIAAENSDSPVNFDLARNKY